MGRIISFIFLSLGLLASANAEEISYVDLFTFKQGIINENETWSGKILILGDVVVPAGKTLTLKKDTWLVFNETDLFNQGQKPTRPELIVQGKLNKPEGTESIKMYSLGDKPVQSYISTNATSETVAISPEAEPLADLEKDLHQSKRQYAWLWVAVYSIWLIL